MRTTALSSPILAMAIVVGGSAPAAAAEPWTLDRAIAYAQRTNPQAKEADVRVERARAALAQANGSFWPRLEVDARYGVTNLPAASFANLVNQKSIADMGFTGFADFDDLPTTDNLAVSGQVSVPLYAGGQRFAQRRAAKHGVAALDHRSRAVRDQLGLEVARTYFAIRRARALKDAAEAAVVAFERNLEVARNRQAAGSMLKQDVLSVEVRLSEARAAALAADNAAKLGLRALAALLALDGPPVDIEATAPPRLAIPGPDAGTIRPELAACQRATDRAEAEVDAAWSGYLPRVGVFGQVVYNQGFVETDGNSVSFVAGLGMGLSLGVDTLSAIRAARHARAAQSFRCATLRDRLRLEVDQARIRIEDAQKRVEVAAHEVELAAQSAALVRDRFEEGLALATQLIEAETALTAARVRRVGARAQEQTAIAELRHALGLPIVDATTTSESKDG